MIHDSFYIIAAYFCFRHFLISCSHIFCTNDKCFIPKYKHNSLIFYSHWYARFNIEAMTFICCVVQNKKWNRTKEITQMILFEPELEKREIFLPLIFDIFRFTTLNKIQQIPSLWNFLQIRDLLILINILNLTMQ